MSKHLYYSLLHSSIFYSMYICIWVYCIYSYIFMRIVALARFFSLCIIVYTFMLFFYFVLFAVVTINQ